MAKLPIIESSRGINTGTTGAQASPRDFYGGGGGSVARALGDVAGAFQVAARAREARAELEDADNLKLAQNNLQREAQDFLDKNKDSPTLADDYEKFFNGRANEIGIGLGEKSSKKWRVATGDLFNASHPSVLKVSAENAINKSIATAQDTMDAAAEGRNKLSAFFPAKAVVTNGFDSAISYLEEATQGKAPAIVDKQRKILENKAFYAILEKDPAGAAQFAKMRVKDAERRQEFVAIAERANKTVDVVAQAAIESSMKASLESADSGDVNAHPVPIEIVSSVLGADKAAQYAVAWTNSQARGAASVAASKLNPEAGEAMAAAARSEAAKTNDPVMMARADGFEKGALIARESLAKDPLKFAQGNEVAVQLSKQSDEAAAAYYKDKTPENLAALRESRSLELDNAARLLGWAPQYATAAEAASYGNQPFYAFRAMRKDRAEQVAAQINEGNASQVFETVNSVLQEYDERHQQFAFNDLVRAGLKMEHQWMFAHAGDKAMQQTISSAIAANKAGAKGFYTTDEMTKALRANGQWGVFKESMTQGGTARIAEAEATENLLRAMAGSSQGGVDAAVQSAVGSLIGKIATPMLVNGHAFMASAKDKNGNVYTPEEQAALAENLTKAIVRFPVEKIDLSRLGSVGGQLAGIEAMDATAAHQLIRNLLTNRNNPLGMLIPNPAGKSAVLAVRDSNGQPIQLMDKNGSPFVIEFDDVPKYETEGLDVTFGSGGGGYLRELLAPFGISGVEQTQKMSPLNAGLIPPGKTLGAKTTTGDITPDKPSEGGFWQFLSPLNKLPFVPKWKTPLNNSLE